MVDLWVVSRDLCFEAPRLIQTDGLQHVLQSQECQRSLDGSSRALSLNAWDQSCPQLVPFVCSVRVAPGFFDSSGPKQFLLERSAMMQQSR